MRVGEGSNERRRNKKFIDGSWMPGNVEQSSTTRVLRRTGSESGLARESLKDEELRKYMVGSWRLVNTEQLPAGPDGEKALRAVATYFEDGTARGRISWQFGRKIQDVSSQSTWRVQGNILTCTIEYSTIVRGFFRSEEKKWSEVLVAVVATHEGAIFRSQSVDGGSVAVWERVG